MTLTDDEVDDLLNAKWPAFGYPQESDRAIYRAGYAAGLAAIPRERGYRCGCDVLPWCSTHGQPFVDAAQGGKHAD